MINLFVLLLSGNSRVFGVISIYVIQFLCTENIQPLNKVFLSILGGKQPMRENFGVTGMSALPEADPEIASIINK